MVFDLVRSLELLYVSCRKYANRKIGLFTRCAFDYTTAGNLLMDIEGIRPRSRRRDRPAPITPVAPSTDRSNTHTSTNSVSAEVASSEVIHDGILDGITTLDSVETEPLFKKSSKRSKRKIILWAIFVAIVLALCAGGFLGWRAYANLHKAFHGTTTIPALQKAAINPNLLDGEGDGRVNILLMGIGGPGHDGADLTDTLVVLSVDPVNNTAAMLSVPRDLWVKQPVNYFGAYQKINAAYESGKYKQLGKIDASNTNAEAVQAGFSTIDTVMKTVLDVQINYHVLVNFEAFRQAIDTVGGVTVDVPTALVDPTMAWENSWNPVLAPAGVQDMNGIKALLYARSRETTSDFARSQRQRQVLIALKDKILNAGTLSNPLKIEGLMNAFGDNIYSDLSTNGAVRLYSIMQKVQDETIASIGLTDEPHKLVTTDRINETSVVRPIAGFENYDAIHQYVRSQLQDGYLLKERAPIAVLGATQIGSDATAATLKSYGYNVVSSGIAATTPTEPVLVDLSNNKSPFTRHYLEARYDIKAVKSLPKGVSIGTSAARFVIIDTK